MNRQLRDIETKLKLLSEISNYADHSQRSLSKKLNIALGLANSIIKKFLKKGLLKLSEAPLRRYSYYITPKGFVEKTKLVSDFVFSSLEFYRNARNDYENILKKAKKENKNIILVGLSDLTDIAIMAAKINNVKIKYIYSENSDLEHYCGVKIKKIMSGISIKKKKYFFVLTASHKNSNISKKFKSEGYPLIKPNFFFWD
ncbi:MAG: hypothetical protein CBB97_13795 [Candidatus Endolissoclinum sp. TMED37]|nr:MAG: hypothetical protein CBB97_13795 [Candidatus Endolissoclinum sp. TMED37]